MSELKKVLLEDRRKYTSDLEKICIKFEFYTQYGL